MIGWGRRDQAQGLDRLLVCAQVPAVLYDADRYSPPALQRRRRKLRARVWGLLVLVPPGRNKQGRRTDMSLGYLTWAMNRTDIPAEPRLVLIALADLADDDGRRAIVAVEGALTCPRCAAGKGCGAGSFQAGDRQRRVASRIPDGLAVSGNDRQIRSRDIRNNDIIMNPAGSRSKESYGRFGIQISCSVPNEPTHKTIVPDGDVVGGCTSILDMSYENIATELTVVYLEVITVNKVDR